MIGLPSWKPERTRIYLNVTFDLVAVRAARCSTPLPFHCGTEPGCGQESHEGYPSRGQGHRSTPRNRTTRRRDGAGIPRMADNFGDSGYIALYRYDGHTAVIVAVRHQKEAGY